MEHIIANFIRNFLEERSILAPYEHGVRKGYSNTTELVSTVQLFSSILDKSGQVDVIFLDFRGAFDKVPHGKLILKFEHIGLPYITWFARLRAIFGIRRNLLMLILATQNR